MCTCAMIVTPFEADVWLGVVVGEGMGSKLQPRQVSFLKKSYDEGAWDETDVPKVDGGEVSHPWRWIRDGCVGRAGP